MESLFLNRLVDYFPAMTYFFSKTNETFVKIPAKWNTFFLFFLKQHSLARFKMLIDLSMLDFPEKKARLHLFYCLLSLRYNARMSVLLSMTEGSVLESVTEIFPGAGWYEREAWDMFGLFFSNHPDLRRILTDYGFKGHPLLKEFPLTGFVEVVFDYFYNRIYYQPVSLTQEYRVWSFSGSYNEVQKLTN